MDELSRRKMLMMSGGALGALAAVGTASPAQARSLSAWAWGGPDSVAGATSGDPRWVWDSEADPVVAGILDRGEVARVNDLLRTWTRNDQPLPAGLPEDLRAFMEQARQLPSWVDRAKLDRAHEFTKAKGFWVNGVYGLGGGIISCAIPREARAVYYSKGGANMKDRVSKTSKLGYDVSQPNAFQPDGELVVTTVKTRLVHAAVRHLLPQSPVWSKTNSGQIPISQNEMLVTWHTLPTLVMRKLTDWRIRVTSADADAFLHVWQVTAHMLGIRDEYIPATWDAAYAQSKQVLDPALGPTPEGVNLADIILNFASELAGPEARPPANALARYFVGDQVADWNGIPREPVWDPLVRAGFPAFVAMREGTIPLPLVPQIAWTIDQAIRKLTLFWLSEGKPISIEIPDANRPS